MSMPASDRSKYRARQAARHHRRAGGHSTTILIVVAVLTASFFFPSSSASTGAVRWDSVTAPQPATDFAPSAESFGNAAGRAPSVFPALFAQLAGVPLAPESIETYASDCITPKSSFVFGEVVCAKVSGGPPLSIVPRRVALIDSDGNVRQVVTLTSETQSITFAPLPSTQASNDSLGKPLTLDNRGVWKVNLIPGSRYSVRASDTFTVSDPSEAAANLFIYNANNSGGSGQVNQNVTYTLWLGNRGPDAASNVEVTTDVPANMTFVSGAQGLGPSFACTFPSAGGTGMTKCKIGSLGPRQAASISLVYKVASGTAPNTVIASVASIASVAGETPAAPATGDPYTIDNTETSELVVSPGEVESCSLSCPADVTAPATTTNQDNVRGALINFAPEALGSCGAVTATPSSGSFFPVGTTTVTVNAAGGSCSFDITVTDDAAPTISCPASLSVTAADGECEASVNPDTPTATGTGVSVTSARSDGRELNDPYTGGVTTITWTATDSQGRTASCQQTITVTTNDTTPPTITAPADITVSTGQDAVSCGIVIGDGSLGSAEADDNCSSSVTITRSGVPAGNVFPKGVTTITYTATDGAGKTATAEQKVTVSDDTAPVIFAPADAAYTCPSEVPAASASQATGPMLDAFGVPQRDDNGDLVPGGAVYDNCGAPVVSVSESRSGAGSAASPLVITRTFTATDGSNNSASAVQTITVIDGTPPTIAAPADKVLYTGAGAASCGITLADLDGALGTAAANDNCAGVTVTRGGGSSFPVGVTMVTYTATDGAGNTATATQKVTVIDNTAPAISVPANIVVTLPTNTPAVSMPVSYAVTATDNCPGAVSLNVSPASGSAFPVGTTLVTATATDAAGNVNTRTFTVTVLYNFTGFFNPVANLPTLNVVNAGRTIPVKFSLSGNKGLNIFAAGSPSSGTIPCDGSAPVSNLDGTVTSGGSSLGYDAASDQYHYNWKTDSSWAGTCRQFVVELNDGSFHRANFRFK